MGVFVFDGRANGLHNLSTPRCHNSNILVKSFSSLEASIPFSGIG